MPEFSFYAHVSCGLHAIIKADSLEEAKDKAHDLATPRLCHQCTDAERGRWTYDEFGDDIIVDQICDDDGNDVTPAKKKASKR